MNSTIRDRMIVSIFCIVALAVVFGLVFVAVGAELNPQKNPVFATLIGFAAGYVVRGMNRN